MFKGVSALSRGVQKQKNGKTSIHFNGDSTNTELLFQTIHSVNQLSVYGAVINSAWQMKKSDGPIYLWTRTCWYHLKKYNSWYLFRQWHLATGSEKTFGASKRWPAEFSSHSYVKKLTSRVVWQPGRSIKLDLTEKTVGRPLLLSAGDTHFPDLFLDPKLWQRFLEEQRLDQFLKFESWKIWKNMG